MGSGGYIGGASTHRSISDNLSSLSSSYDYHNGYFGEKGQGRNFTRNIISDNPQETAKDFFDKAAYGGIAKDMGNGKGKLAKMKDGTIVSMRETSSSDGSPAVEINIKESSNHGDLKAQKIHFVMEDKQ